MKEHGREHAGAAGKAHYEHKVSCAPVCGEKYASQSTMGNPEELLKNEEALVSYVKKNKMKY